MKKATLTGIALILFGIVFSIQVQAQDRKVVTTMAADVPATRGEDPNITSDMPTTDEPAEKPAASRGSKCSLMLENCTGLTINIYVNGAWGGTVVPYSGYITTPYSGKTIFYAKSVGGTKTWGPVEFDCDEAFTWRFLKEDSECIED